MQPVKEVTFYCKNRCGHPDFSFDEWDKVDKHCEAMGIEGDERLKLLKEYPCDRQCFDCMADVGKRREQTNTLINGQRAI